MPSYTMDEEALFAKFGDILGRRLCALLVVPELRDISAQSFAELVDTIRAATNLSADSATGRGPTQRTTGPSAQVEPSEQVRQLLSAHKLALLGLLTGQAMTREEISTSMSVRPYDVTLMVDHLIENGLVIARDRKREQRRSVREYTAVMYEQPSVPTEPPCVESLPTAEPPKLRFDNSPEGRLAMLAFARETARKSRIAVELEDMAEERARERAEKERKQKPITVYADGTRSIVQTMFVPANTWREED